MVESRVVVVHRLMRNGSVVALASGADFQSLISAKTTIEQAVSWCRPLDRPRLRIALRVIVLRSALSLVVSIVLPEWRGRNLHSAWPVQPSTLNALGVARSALLTFDLLLSTGSAGFGEALSRLAGFCDAPRRIDPFTRNHCAHDSPIVKNIALAFAGNLSYFDYIARRHRWRS